MYKFQNILSEISEEKADKFKDLVGSYNFQGHLSKNKKILLKNTQPSNVDPIPYMDLIGGKAKGHYHPPNGFWTSTIYKGYEGFVTKWLKSKYQQTENQYFHAYTIDGNPDIIHLESRDDVFKLYDESKYYDYNKENEKVVRWKDIAEDKDDVHVYGSAIDTVYFKHWTVESTVWFNPLDYLKEEFTWKIQKELSDTSHL